jgi:hypothetical protein
MIFMSSVRSNRTRKKHRNIEKIRFGSIELIRLNSVRFDIPGKIWSFTVYTLKNFKQTELSEFYKKVARHSKDVLEY